MMASAPSPSPSSKATRLLLDQAAELRPWPAAADGGGGGGDGACWELAHPDGRVQLYVDPAGVVDGIVGWAETALFVAGHRAMQLPPPPLLITGLVKTGKTYCQANVVPAAVAGAEGAAALLRELLALVLRWAREEGVPVRDGLDLQAARELAARPGVDPSDVGALGDAIRRLLHAVEVPVLVLCDEVQSLFLPTFGDEPDAQGAPYIRDIFAKYLLLSGPRTLLWCLTGSCMSQTWISIADMPTHGHALITHIYDVALPASHSRAHMELAWRQLQQELRHGELEGEQQLQGQQQQRAHPSVQEQKQQQQQLPSPDSSGVLLLDPALLRLCAPSIAVLAAMVREWAALLTITGPQQQPQPDVAAFVDAFTRTTLLAEARKEWGVGLAGLPAAQRLAVRGTAYPGFGAHMEAMWSVMPLPLDPPPNCVHHGLLLVGPNGALRDGWDDAELGGGTLVQLDGRWLMQRLGEVADHLMGPPRAGAGAGANAGGRRWRRGPAGSGKPLRPTAGTAEFRDRLQAIALAVAEKLEEAQRQQQGVMEPPPADGGGVGGGAAAASAGVRELWTRQAWFQEVLQLPCNHRDREWYGSHSHSAALSSHLDMLVFFLRLSRNVLAHMQPWAAGGGGSGGGSDTAAVVPADVRVLEALPSALDQPLSEFLATAQEALGVLTQETVEEAATAFAAEGTCRRGKDGREGSGGSGVGGKAPGGGGSRMAGRTGSGGGRKGGRTGGDAAAAAAAAVRLRLSV
ncbi:hypothetical protein GPECTOR_21g761 [Gonium pectorale]|uniref:Uncharacterized protein n=1 Tax=Gonium pectorale TaxID=33097 RepID=A0A150GI92_GONPE|nr:hypothetical protein GPECTOR_21g761 [Gonium pectorale]|eukprot:KXZ49533.1 hypothetical protein GPECTOR_21g761 [Gonium pectorale]